MNLNVKSCLIVVVLVSVVGLAACKQEGPAEKAGQKFDQVIEQAGKKMEQAGDAFNEKSKKAGEYVEDSAITVQVKAELASDPLLKMSRITATTTKGVVRLSGVVDSQQYTDRALEITRNIKGVVAVENNLVVQGAN
jgi:hyperosmotically inducible periplasmic protein